MFQTCCIQPVSLLVTSALLSFFKDVIYDTCLTASENVSDECKTLIFILFFCLVIEGWWIHFDGVLNTFTQKQKKKMCFVCWQTVKNLNVTMQTSTDCYSDNLFHFCDHGDIQNKTSQKKQELESTASVTRILYRFYSHHAQHNC